MSLSQGIIAFLLVCVAIASGYYGRREYDSALRRKWVAGFTRGYAEGQESANGMVIFPDDTTTLAAVEDIATEVYNELQADS